MSTKGASHSKPKARRKKSLVRRSRVKTGEIPGALPKAKEAVPSTMRLTVFDGDTIHTTENATLEDTRKAKAGKRKLWLDVIGITDAEVIAQLGKLFAIPDLALEDVMTFHQRPKAEELDSCTFVVTHMVDGKSTSSREQFSLFFAPEFVVSFQEHAGDCLGPVRNRLDKQGARIRTAPCDYLAYAIIDTIVDHYFPLVETIGERLEDLEDLILLSPDESHMGLVHECRRDLIAIKRSLWPMREIIQSLRDHEHSRVSDTTRVYLRDTQDHVLQLIDITETSRELAAGLTDLYLNSVSNRMNDTVRVLTVISTIFIPLSFLAGVWGMNFTGMALLDKDWGYPLALFIMTAIAVALLGWFRFKRWL